MQRSIWLGMLAAGVALTVGAAASAQTAGAVDLAAGFMPDPQRLSGVSGGPVQASQLNPACRGWIAQQPNHAMNLQTGFAFLRVFAESQSDTTLVIRAPNGQFLCNDDTYGFNPAVDAAYGPGQYLVWVGSYSQSNPSPYTISFSELRSSRPAGGPATTASTLGTPSGVPRVVTARGLGGGAITDFRTTTATALVAQPCTVSTAQVVVRGRHTFNGDLIVRLRSPSGETVTLQSNARTSPFRRHSTSRFAGSSGTGAWVLSVEDNVRADSGRLNGFDLTLTCR